jgi:hypothetical protein
MATQLLNYYQNAIGIWSPPQADAVDYYGIDLPITPPGATVRLHSSSRSGMVNLSPKGGSLTSNGDIEVFVQVSFTNNTYTYVSAPLNTPIDFQDVAQLRLGVLFVVGNPGCTEIAYRAYFNANLVYEIL